MRNLGEPKDIVGPAQQGITKIPTGAVNVAGATLGSGGGVTASGALRSDGEKGRSGVDNCDKVSGGKSGEA